MRFYIHLDNGDGYTADEEGCDWSSLDTAKAALIHAAADIVVDELKAGQETVRLTLYLENEHHEKIMELPLKASLTR